MTQRITLDPSNPVQGGQLTICYDFSDLRLSGTRLEVEFFPGPNTTTQEVTKENPCFTVTVPSNAISVLVKDLDGPSPDKSAVVRPGCE